MTTIENNPAFAQQPKTTQAELDAGVEALRRGSANLRQMSLSGRVALIGEVIVAVTDSAKEWSLRACQAKRIQSGSVLSAEDVLTGPLATLRFLQIVKGLLTELAVGKKPTLPGVPKTVEGQLRVPVFPTKLLYDEIFFKPFTAETWLDPEVIETGLFGQNVERVVRADTSPSVEVVLGAGNVSSIPATDALTKIFLENAGVALKMNPVNDYLGPVFSQAFKPLIDHDLLRISYGGPDVGQHLIGHDGTDAVHITGSANSHNRIVWGPPEQQEQRRAENDPVLTKTITSELSNVSPWAIVPADYSEKELRAIAENFAASITNNASFNCIASKVLLTSRHWKQRRKFLDLVKQIFAKSQRRYAYYPGAAQRHERFSGQTNDGSDELPWVLLEDADIEGRPYLIDEESFTCVCAEWVLESESDVDFLNLAVDMMNDRIWGTLAATLTVSPEFETLRTKELDRAISRLRYGTVAINHWPALAFAWMTPPWGGYPGATLHDPLSGIGFVHNTYLLDKPQKTVIRGPIRLTPKPVWYSTHRHPQKVAWSLLRLYSKPSLTRLAQVAWWSFTG